MVKLKTLPKVKPDPPKALLHHSISLGNSQILLSYIRMTARNDDDDDDIDFRLFGPPEGY
jgi:hypothetical protein